MVKGLLLIQFSPARSGAGWPDVIAVPGLGQITQMLAETAMRAQKVTDRNISFLRFLHPLLDGFRPVLVAIAPTLRVKTKITGSKFPERKEKNDRGDRNSPLKEID